MTRRVVDTSTLIFLARIGRLELLRLGVQQVLVPSEVMAEIRAGQDEVYSLVQTYGGKWLQGCSVSADNVEYVQGLGRGERAVLSQAVACGVRSVAMDDLAARKVAH
jgi:predicted nucleic acid-binding protein